MGIDPKNLPPKFLDKMIEDNRPPSVLTPVEPVKRSKPERRESEEQADFRGWLISAELRKELTFNQPKTNEALTSRPGFPDFVIHPDHRPDFFIEFKLASGRISGIQKHVFKLLRDLGKPVFIVRTADEAKRVVVREICKPYVN